VYILDMPKGPTPENARNPLRALRSILTEPDKYRFSQEELAALLGVSTSYVRAIENGKRSIPGDLFREITIRTGAEWDSRSKSWITFFPEFSRPALFTLSVYKEVKKLSRARPPDSINLQADVISEIFELFLMIPDSRWWELYSKFMLCLSDCRAEFNYQKLSKLYSETSNRSEVLTDTKASLKNFLATYQGKLGDEGLQRRGWVKNNLPPKAQRTGKALAARSKASRPT
jgi:transcriptional regulator with XRE-family HTH domain